MFSLDCHVPGNTQLPTEIKEVMLNLGKQCSDVIRSTGGDHHTNNAIQFIGGAIGGDPQTGFRYPGAITQPCGPGITGSSVDFCESVTQLCPLIRASLLQCVTGFIAARSIVTDKRPQLVLHRVGNLPTIHYITGTIPGSHRSNLCAPSATSIMKFIPHKQAPKTTTAASLVAAGCLYLATSAVSPLTAQDIGDTGYNNQSAEPTGRLIIKYIAAEKPWQSPRGSKRKLRSALRKSRGLSFERKLSDTRELVAAGERSQDLASRRELSAMARSLSAQSDIEYAAVEYRRYPLLEPNDPLYQGTQSVGNQNYLYEGEYSVHTPGAWDITTGSESSVIAIVDTGVLPDHPDLNGRSVTGLGYDFVSADSPDIFTSANDGDGRDIDPSDPGDPCSGGSSSWHGTGVASVAAGTSNNSEGLAGIDWNARILHARALGICGGTDADIIDAIRWSAGLSVTGIPDNPTPANVVNLSLGGATECTKAWQDVIDELTALNVVFVMAAGNEATNALRSSPANCANVITVGSNTSTGELDSGFSNYGLKVTISTSGRNILVASNNGADAPNDEGDFYRTETGTSFSAAIVSGAVSLMHSLNPDLGPSEVRAVLHESATPYASGTDCDLYHCGAGIMNLARALNAIQNNNYNPERNIALELIQNQSTPIASRREINAALFGYKDTRYFTIEVPQRGLLQAESTSDEDLYGYLLNEELSVIALDDDSGEAINNFRVASLVEAGTYFIAVERSVHRRTDGEATFSLTTSLSADAPDAFEFSPETAAPNDAVGSETITISGLQAESVLTVSDGFYSLNEGALTNTPATIRNGDTLQVVTQSHGSAGGTVTTLVTVGSYSTSFTVTTSTNGSNSGSSSTGAGSNTSSGCSITSPTHSNVTPIDPLLLLLLITSGIALKSRRRLYKNA